MARPRTGLILAIVPAALLSLLMASGKLSAPKQLDVGPDHVVRTPASDPDGSSNRIVPSRTGSPERGAIQANDQTSPPDPRGSHAKDDSGAPSQIAGADATSDTRESIGTRQEEDDDPAKQLGERRRGDRLLSRSTAQFGTASAERAATCAYLSEPRDASWADHIEVAARKAANSGGVSIVSGDCRTSICRYEITAVDGNEAYPPAEHYFPGNLGGALGGGAPPPYGVFIWSPPKETQHPSPQVVFIFSQDPAAMWQKTFVAEVSSGCGGNSQPDN
jgi:hypothetical protein